MNQGPSGRPVLLFAGFRAPATSWLYQVDVLERTGYPVFAVGLRGHGRADRPSSGVIMERRGHGLAEVLENLDPREALLVGGSMDGNTIWSDLAQSCTERIAGIVVDQTPAMLNTDDWPHGFYGYDTTNVDTNFAEGIPDTGHGTSVRRCGGVAGGCCGS